MAYVKVSPRNPAFRVGIICYDGICVLEAVRTEPKTKDSHKS